MLCLVQLSVVSVRDIGPDYAITLRAWREAWRVRHTARTERTDHFALLLQLLVNPLVLLLRLSKSSLMASTAMQARLLQCQCLLWRKEVWCCVELMSWPDKPTPNPHPHPPALPAAASCAIHLTGEASPHHS
jgi:hypothetical protein